MAADSIPSKAVRSEFADVVTVILFAAASAIVVIFTTAMRLVDMFREQGFAWKLPIDEMPIEATLGSGAHSVEGYVSEALVVSPNVNTTSMIAGGASAVAWAVTALIVIGIVVFVAWSFLRQRFFVPATARAISVLGWALVLGGVTVLACNTMARNGVLAAIGGTEIPAHPTEFWGFAPVWATGIAVGLIGHAFRRGIRLQRDTEGLV